MSETHLAWKEALSQYKYQVDLRLFVDSSRYPNWFGRGYFRSTANPPRMNKFGGRRHFARGAKDGDIRITPVFGSMGGLGLRSPGLGMERGEGQALQAVQ